MEALSASVARKDLSSNNVYIDLLDLDNEPLLEYRALHRKSLWSDVGDRRPRYHGLRFGSRCSKRVIWGS